jgi:ubiquinone/menaquinone biosynthesis C-methylase UbiE
MWDRFAQRSYELEHLDLGDYTPEEYEGCIAELRLINLCFGEARALRRTLWRDVTRAGVGDFSVLDVGAGSGELLRQIATWQRSTGRSGRLLGIELNERAARAIAENSAACREIEALRGDALRLPLGDSTFDYSICSLFTHHFVEEQVVAILGEMARVARRGIYVLDLHRHPLPYYVYTRLGPLVLRNRLTRDDGALSILRGFVPKELAALARQAGLEGIRVERVFPYRLVLSGKKSAK